MFGDNQISDKELAKAVNKRLLRGGGGGVDADVRQGSVTLRGKIRYETQRKPILRLVTRISGVRRVIDQLQLMPIRT
jgi:osmotically-inducible protein OsmY